MVMAAFGVLSLAAIPAVGPMVARLGRRGAMQVSFALLAGSALAFLLIRRADGLAALLRGLQGVAWSLFFAAGMSLLAEAVPPGRLGHAIGLYGGASLATNAIAPAVTEPIAAWLGPRAVFTLSALVAAAGGWFCRRIPRGPQWAGGPRAGCGPTAFSRIVGARPHRARGGRAGGRRDVHVRGAVFARARHRRSAWLLRGVHGHRPPDPPRRRPAHRSARASADGAGRRRGLRAGRDRHGPRAVRSTSWFSAQPSAWPMESCSRP